MDRAEAEFVAMFEAYHEAEERGDTIAAEQLRLELLGRAPCAMEYDFDAEDES